MQGVESPTHFTPIGIGFPLIHSAGLDRNRQNGIDKQMKQSKTKTCVIPKKLSHVCDPRENTVKENSNRCSLHNKQYRPVHRFTLKWITHNYAISQICCSLNV